MRTTDNGAKLLGVYNLASSIGQKLDHGVRGEMRTPSLVLFAVVVWTTAAPAEPPVQLKGDEVVYTNEVKEDAAGVVCEISLAIFSTKRPETVNFRLYTYRPKRNGSVGTGYTLDAGDMVYPNQISRKQIFDPAFSSESFSSAGHLDNIPCTDGGVGAVTHDPHTRQAFVAAFFNGQFQISFRQNGVEGFRSYAVNTEVPINVIAKFNRCLHDPRRRAALPKDR